MRITVGCYDKSIWCKKCNRPMGRYFNETCMTTQCGSCYQILTIPRKVWTRIEDYLDETYVPVLYHCTKDFDIFSGKNVTKG